MSIIRGRCGELKGAKRGAKPARGGIRQMGRAKDVTGFRKIERVAYDDCAGCAKAAGHIQVIKASYTQDDSIKRSATLK